MLTKKSCVSCDRCSGWNQSLETVIDILENEISVCDGCASGAAMRVIARQFQLRTPKWWVVDGRAVVPIWIVERLRTRMQKVS